MDQVKQMIKACIVSRKGGVPVKELDREYSQLVGTKIPYAKYGFLSLEDFIQSIAEVMMVRNPDGSIILKARDTKTSHIASLVDRQKTAHKKVANCYQMSSAGQNYMHGVSSNRYYEKNRGNNNRKMERITPEHVTQSDYNLSRQRKQEMGPLHTLHAESLFKHRIEKEMTPRMPRPAEKYSFKSAYKENEVHHCQTKHALKMSSHHFQQRNNTGATLELDDSRDAFNQSQVKNHRRISVDDTILVTIVNNYYQRTTNEGFSPQRRSLLSEWITGEEEGEVQQDQLCRRSQHKGYSKEISTVRQKYSRNPSRVGEPVDRYEELYVQKKWIGDSVNVCAENVIEDYIREDSDYTHYKRDLSRKMPGLLVKVKNEYAIDRHI